MLTSLVIWEWGGPYAIVRSMAGTTKRGLGRGFESLLAPDFNKAALLVSSDDRIEKIDVGTLQANPYQPRHHFDEATLQELAASIKHYGIVQPLVVMPAKAGVYTLIAGERRWRAAQLAGLKQVPAIVRSSKQLEQLEIALIENVQRVDLSPLEQAISIERWHDQFSISYDLISKRLGKAPSTVNNIVRLLQLPEAARKALEAQQITEGHARSILALKANPDQMAHLLNAIIKLGWSVREAERYVLSVKAGAKDHRQAKQRVVTETPMTKKLGKHLHTAVRVRRTAKGGVLEIGFRDDGDLERIIGQIG